jgi:hypothetical protein
VISNNHTDPTKLQKSNVNIIENESTLNYVQNNNNNQNYGSNEKNPYGSSISSNNTNKNLYQTIKIFNSVKFVSKICNKCGVYGHDENDCVYYHKLYKNYLIKAKSANERFHNGNYKGGKQGWNRFNNDKRFQENKSNFKTKSYDKKQDTSNEINNINTEPFPTLKPLYEKNES